ncbi:iron-enterobactin transporter permease [Klebsiella pneumoniae JM45]|nr:iron-enterobactin transporter permease [Klebsiella pneumoniae JM45]
MPGLLLLLALAAALSLTIGAKSLPIGTVFTAFSGTCQSADCTIVLDARLPRTLAGLLAGVALGLAGALMQTLTRNPLADPGLLGVNSGASFAIVLGAALFGITSPQEQLLLAFCGALCASLLVAFTGSQGGGQLSPVRLTLAGVALAAVLEGLSNGIALLNPDVYDQLRFWQAGSLDIRTLQTLKIVLLPVVVAGIAALLLSRALNSLSLGNDTATALGSRVARTQLIGLIVITVLCGSATAVVGPIAFIGLMMPHMARWLVGADHRWSLPVPCSPPGPAAVCRRDWPPAGARRTAGIGGVRLSRRAGADLAGAPPAAGRWPVIAPSRRLIASCLLLMAASLLISLLGLAQGPVPLTIDQVFSALFGDAPRNVAMVVNEWRLPRVLMALLIGAALGVSGAIFQSLTRNPLGSPDVMGFNTGAWSGVLVAMVLFGQNLTAIALAAMAGGVLTSLVVWLLAWRNGIETFRLIIIGIGVRAMLVAFNTWLLLRASLETALSAGLWNAGSLNGLTWGKTWPSAPLILLMLVGSALLVRRMRLLEMGDDTACALGVQVERSRLLLMLVAVVLTAASTALAGPISFIALVAPHIARRLSGTARWGLTQSALCGALLLALADYGAQRLFMPWQLPVGVLTVSLGGIYLIALLIQESRKK